jgi:hypothetical protein
LKVWKKLAGTILSKPNAKTKTTAFNRSIYL